MSKMNKKEAIIPISFLLLSVLFAFICTMVFLTKGKSAKWLARKMKIGGLLLTLTAASCNGGNEEPNCYVQVAPNSINLNAYAGDTIALDLDTNNILYGTIYEVTRKEFSFAIIDRTHKKIQKGNLIPQDGKFNSGNEDFSIEIDKDLAKDKYELRFYESNIETQDNAPYQYNYNIQIK